MKTLTPYIWLIPLAGIALPAQIPTEPPMAAPMVAAPLYSAEQLDQLLGPIALYPDALIALILPASTSPSDIVLAARYLQGGGDPLQVDAQPWDDSVRGLAHYPQVIAWMDQNLTWTRQLGEAFANQPTDVMNTIQRLRARARAAGTLMDTPQQQVVYADGQIEIIPAQPDYIYVPYYDPAVVYAAPGRYLGYGSSAFFAFSPPCVTGWWLSFGFDWGHRRVWTVDRGDRERFWREHRDDWRRHEPPRHFAGPEFRTWEPRRDRRPDGRSDRFSPSRPPFVPSASPRTEEARRWEGSRNFSGPSRTPSNPSQNDERRHDSATRAAPNFAPAAITGNPAQPVTPQPATANPYRAPRENAPERRWNSNVPAAVPPPEAAARRAPEPAMRASPAPNYPVQTGRVAPPYHAPAPAPAAPPPQSPPPQAPQGGDDRHADRPQSDRARER